MDENRISDRPKAGAGLSAWEAMQLAALLGLPLSHFGLSETPENRKTLDKLRAEYEEIERRGMAIDITS